MPEPQPEARSFFIRYQRLIGVVGFLVLLLVLVELSGVRENFTLDYVRATLNENLLVGGAFFVLLFCIGNLIQIPGWIFLAAAVLTLDKLYGGLLTYVAAVTSCLVTYAVIRLIGGDALRELDSNLAVRIFRYMDAYPIASIFALRTIFQTAPALNYSLALARVKVPHYIIGTMIGLPLPILGYCLAFELLFEELL